MKLTEILFSPFQRVAGGTALGLGLGAILAAALVGAAQGLHFDGVLDVHAGYHAPWWLFVAEGLINWLCLAGLLLGAGRMISGTAFRAVDLLGTQALARWPMLVAALACLAPGFHRYSAALVKALGDLKPGAAPALPEGGADAAVFALVTLVVLACTVWMVALMWKSFSLCCNVRGGKAVAYFVAGLLVAEGLSKVLITALARVI